MHSEKNSFDQDGCAIGSAGRRQYRQRNRADAMRAISDASWGAFARHREGRPEAGLTVYRESFDEPRKTEGQERERATPFK